MADCSLYKRRPIQALHLLRHPYDDFAFRNNPFTKQRSGVSGPLTAVCREQLKECAAEFIEFTGQPGKPIGLRRAPIDRLILLQCADCRLVGLLHLTAIIVGRARSRIEERITHIDGTQKDLGPDIRQEIL